MSKPSETGVSTADAIEKAVVIEYPRLLYKVQPLPPHPPPPPEFEIITKVVQDKDEEGKAEGEGWSKDVPELPKPKGRDEAKPGNGPSKFANPLEKHDPKQHGK